MATNYYDRFNADKRYEKHLFIPDRVLQAAEVNEIQSRAAYQTKSIGDAVFRDGDIIRDAQIIVDQDTGAVACESGAIYIRGEVRGVPPSTLSISLTGTVVIGVYLTETIITEAEDATLIDPATETSNYGEGGAHRLQVNPAWGIQGSGQDGDFFPIYYVDDGVQRAKEAPPSLDSLSQAIAKYDRDSTGSNYVVSGMQVKRLADSGTSQVFDVAAGRARINGYGVELYTSRRVTYPANPVIQLIDSEPKTSGTLSLQRVDVDRPPIRTITQVRITREKTATIVHSTVANSQDPIPDSSVVEIVSAVQGGTTYTKGTDFQLTAGNVDWSLGGAEPTAGSSYSLTYRYIATVSPQDADATGFSVLGAVPGTLILTNYESMLPRIDRLCLDETGAMIWVEGVSTLRSPAKPQAPSNVLPLALVYQFWDDSTYVVSDGVRTVSMAEIENYSARIDQILDMVAHVTLRQDAGTRESVATKGLFTDPFLDDSMRDVGVAQTGAIADGMLMLPISATPLTPSADVAQPEVCAYSLETVLSNTSRTSTMNVNPYMAFDILPAEVTLNPAVDRWQEVYSSSQKSTVTKAYEPTAEEIERWYPFVIGPGSASGSSKTLLKAASSKTSTSATQNSGVLEYLRQIDVAFEIKGFGNNELLQTVTFDGIQVGTSPSTINANAQGSLSGTFTIPPDVLAGTKEVKFVGAAGGNGTASFVGEGTWVENITTKVTTVTSAYYDPLAQTFLIDQDRQIAAIDIFVATIGTSDLVVQLRETSIGYPTQVVIGEARLRAAEVVAGEWNRFTFAKPITVPKSQEHAIVVASDDAITSVGISVLGEWDAENARWVTSQAYNVGVLLSSANASTWTAHQDRRLAFRLQAAHYTQATRTINLGTIAVTDLTDLIILAMTDNPATGADADIEVTFSGGDVRNTSDRQIVQLTGPVSGNVTVRAILRATDYMSASISPGTQLIAGTIGSEGTYVSRSFKADDDPSTLRLIVEAVVPSGSSLTAYASGGEDDDPWVELSQAVAPVAVNGNVYEFNYRLTNFDHPAARVKLALAGSAAARPRAANLRVSVT